MTYDEAVQFIDSFINYERTTEWEYPEAVKLDRMRQLAKELGNPQNAYESIIIAGSKGKGSTAALLSSILRMDNFKVGLYTSPHLVDIRERIQMNGLMVSEARFVDYALLLRRIIEGYEWRKNPPTYFEVLTAMAFHHFKEMKAQVAVLEVGLGGLYDSTNIAAAKVVGLSPISLEHTDKLGKTISKITVQKCGIIKGREIVVSGPQTEEVEAVIVKVVEENDAQLVRLGREIKVFERDFGEDFQRFDVRSAFGDYFNLELKLLGRYQMDNAAQAIGLAKALESKTRFKISDAAVKQGVADARWPGRLEKIADGPKIILDGAQNADSMRKLVAAVKRHFTYEKLITVLGVSADKDLEGILAELLPETSVFVATQADSPRALGARIVAESVKAHEKEVFLEEKPLVALEKARSLASPVDLVLVAGSLFLVGDIKREVRG